MTLLSEAGICYLRTPSPATFALRQRRNGLHDLPRVLMKRCRAAVSSSCGRDSISADTPVEDVLPTLGEWPILVMDGDGPDALGGILTASDLL